MRPDWSRLATDNPAERPDPRLNFNTRPEQTSSVSAGIKSVPVEDGFKLSRLDGAIDPCFDGGQVSGKNACTQGL